MKYVCATMCVILMACGLYADAHSNSTGALMALILASLWFVGFIGYD